MYLRRLVVLGLTNMTPPKNKVERFNHPQTTINNAQRRLLDTVKNSQIYEIVEYEVYMCDDIYDAKKYILEELEEKGIKLPEDYDIDVYIEVAQFEVAKRRLIKTLQSSALSEEERAEISMLNTLYPITVAMKGLLVKEFEL